ncbi:hypothetical protein J7L67_09915 [bacterium]|nr:hypothetical protein [bacterium]
MTEDTIGILYRVDGGYDMGLGHLARARSLCAEMLRIGIKPVILSFADEELLKEFFPQELTVYKISHTENELDYIIYLTQCLNSRILIQDIRDTDEFYCRCLKSLGLFIIGFDDCGEGRNLYDILIDANLPEDEGDYKNVPFRFFGEKFILLDPLFADYNLKDKTVPRKVKNILLSFGGSDPRRLTQWSLNMLNEVLKDYSVSVAAGKSIKHQYEIGRFCQSLGFKYIFNCSDMPKLLYESDIALISGGITLYEAAAVGTPAVVIPQVEHQYKIGKRFESMGSAVCPVDANNLDAGKIIKTLNNLIENHNLRRKMSSKGKNIVDAQGVYRIGNVIEFVVKSFKGETSKCENMIIN